MPGKARIAVIGTGWWSTYTHIPGLQANEGAELVALCDSNAQKLRAAAEAYHITKTYADYTELLQQEALDGAIVATNHVSHYEIVRCCLEHGLHVMVEKPMTLLAWHARELAELARARKLELIVGYPNNFTAHALRAREVLASGALGPIQFVIGYYNSTHVHFMRGDDGAGRSSPYPVHGPGAAYSRPELSGGGQGQTQITHLGGLLFFVTGLRAARVTGLMANFGLPLDLVNSMAVAFEGGALGMVGGTGNSGEGGRNNLLVYCERGHVEMNMFAGTMSIRGKEIAPEDYQPLQGKTGYDRFSTTNNLVDVILGRAPNGAPGEIGWRVVELLDAAYRSAERNGQPVDVVDLYPQAHPPAAGGEKR